MRSITCECGKVIKLMSIGQPDTLVMNDCDSCVFRKSNEHQEACGLYVAFGYGDYNDADFVQDYEGDYPKECPLTGTRVTFKAKGQVNY